MFSRLRPRLTFANVVSVLALFVALSAGAYAATQLPKNSVGTKQLKSGAVGTSELHNNAVKSSKIAPNAIKGSDVKESALAKVPRARHADAAATLAGKAPSAFAPASSASKRIDYNESQHNQYPCTLDYKFKDGPLTLESKASGSLLSVSTTAANATVSWFMDDKGGAGPNADVREVGTSPVDIPAGGGGTVGTLIYRDDARTIAIPISVATLQDLDYCILNVQGVATP